MRSSARAITLIDEQREALAEYAHTVWSEWMRWQFSVCQSNEDGSVTIPSGYYKALLWQMNTPYADLTEAEKTSDRAEADKMLAIVRGSK